MGLEAQCTVRLGGKTSKGKALLESEELVFRGEFRLKIPFNQISSVSARGGRLAIKFPDGTAFFELGPAAARWADKILHPKNLLDKLGVNAGANVSVLRVSDKNFLRPLRERTPKIGEGRLRKDSDVIFLGAEKKSELARLRSVIPSLQKSGAVWMVYPKGQPQITQSDVMAAAKSAGLVDVKVCSFSATHTALKLVIPLAAR